MNNNKKVGGYVYFPDKIVDAYSSIRDVKLFVYIVIKTMNSGLEEKNIIIPRRIIKLMGRKPRSGNGNINNIVIDAINEIIRDYSTTNLEIDNVGEVFFINKLYIPDGESFSKINYSMVNKIFNSDNPILSSTAPKMTAFNMLGYIISKTYNRIGNLTSGGSAKVFRTSYEELSYYLDLNKSTIEKYIHKLLDLDLIDNNLNSPVYYATLGDNWVRGKTIYVIKNSGWEDELEQGIKQYKYALEKLGNKVVIKKDKASDKTK